MVSPNHGIEDIAIAIGSKTSKNEKGVMVQGQFLNNTK